MNCSRIASLFFIGALTIPAITVMPAAIAQTQPTEQNPAAPPPVTLDLRDVPLQEALTQLFQVGQRPFTVDSTLNGRVTLSVKDHPFEETLRLLLHAAEPRATYGRETGVYIIRPVPKSGTIAGADVPDLPVATEVLTTTREKLDKATPPLTLSLKETPALTALTQLLDSTRLGYEFDPTFYQDTQKVDLPPKEITLRLSNVPITKALDAVTRTLGIGWTAEENKGTFTIRFVRLRDTRTLTDLLKGGGTVVTANGVVAPVGGFGGGGLGGGGFGGGGFGGGGQISGGSGYWPTQFDGMFPKTRVKLDVRQGEVRQALSDLFKQAKVDFAIDEDVTGAGTFVFENVTLNTALNTVCESAGIGWNAEQTPSGLLIRIGKRYVRR